MENTAVDGAAWGSQFGLLTSSVTSTLELPGSPGRKSTPHSALCSPPEWGGGGDSSPEQWLQLLAVGRERVRETRACAGHSAGHAQSGGHAVVPSTHLSSSCAVWVLEKRLL